MIAVSFRNVTKTFPRHSGQQLIQQHVKRLFSRTLEPPVPFCALRDISFEVPAGEGLAVIGSNGAGKSTLLGLTAGLARPTSGTIEVNGRIAALLELGSGFHPDLTGAENVRLYASLMGMTERETNEQFDSIVEVLGRPGFHWRTAAHVLERHGRAPRVFRGGERGPRHPDHRRGAGRRRCAFRAKCFDRILHLRRAGKTFLCVSHSKEMLADICDRGIWLERGHAMLTGSLDEVFRAYTDRLTVTA